MPMSKQESKTKKIKIKQEEKSVGNKTEKPKLTKTEWKAKYNELKWELKQVWSTEMESEDKKQENLSVPSHFNSYTIHDRKIIVQ